MITTEDINVVVVAALNAQAALTGKAHPGRAPDDPAAYPYVVFTATARDAEIFSGSQYVQKWRVKAAAYIPVGAPDAIGVGATVQALCAALAVSGAAVVANLRNSGEKVLHSVPVTAEEGYEPKLREGKDVLAAGVTVELLCQGNRGVA